MSDPDTPREGILIVLSAPSGAGKTTVALAAMERVEGLEKSVSHTTRHIREGESDGVDYHFTNVDRFKEMVSQGAFLEWAEVHGNYYGTSFEAIENSLSNGVDIMLVIDTQGAKAISDKNLNSASIFLLPPSLEELESRLRGRGTDPEDVIQARLANAAGELAEKESFDHQVVNDLVERAVIEVCSIIEGERKQRNL